jgi:chromosome segregation ATPase
MVTLEQVKLLETKVVKALDYTRQVSNENVLLKGKLDSYQKRIDELEVLIQRFKEDQSRIEEGILSALERLNQFEDAIEKSLSGGREGADPAAEKPQSEEPPRENAQEFSAEERRNEDSASDSSQNEKAEEADSGTPTEPQNTGELDIF